MWEYRNHHPNIKEVRGELREDSLDRERLEMTKVGQICFCEICGNKVEVVEAGAGALVCCGKPMKLVKT